MYLHPLLADLPAEEKAAFLQHSRLLAVKKNDVLLAAGAVVKHMYCVASGVVRVETLGSDSLASTTGFLGPNDTHTETVLGKDQPSGSSLVAALNSSVYAIPLDTVRSTAMRYPAFAMRLLELSVERQHKLRRQLRRIAAATPEAVVGRTLYELSEVAGAGPNTVDKRITQSTIAAYSGLSRERVNRTMRDLESRGLIKRGNTGIVVDTGFSNTSMGDLDGLPPDVPSSQHQAPVEVSSQDMLGRKPPSLG